MTPPRKTNYPPKNTDSATIKLSSLTKKHGSVGRETGAVCRIFTTEEFLRAPSEAADIAARGTCICINTANGRIIVGSGQRSLHTAQRWSVLLKLPSKICNIFRSGTGPLDVSWIE